MNTQYIALYLAYWAVHRSQHNFYPSSLWTLFWTETMNSPTGLSPKPFKTIWIKGQTRFRTYFTSATDLASCTIRHGWDGSNWDFIAFINRNVFIFGYKISLVKTCGSHSQVSLCCLRCAEFMKNSELGLINSHIFLLGIKVD